MPLASKLTQVERPLNLRESVIEQLRASIVTGELQEGELISAPAIGAALGVSATPVREAMMDLVREGLVETVKNKGFRITGMTEKDLDDITALRLLIEPPAMPLVIGKISDEGFARLTELANQCQHGAESEDLVEYLKNDRDFHALLLSYADNPLLTELATSLRFRTRMYGLKALASMGKLTESTKEHHRLIDLVRQGKGEEAQQLLALHIGHARGQWATGDFQ